MLHKATDIDVKVIILDVGKASNIFWPHSVSWHVAKSFEPRRDKLSLGE